MKAVPAWLFRLLCAASAAVLVGSCTLTEGAFMEGATDALATGKFLQVATKPPSLGYKRLRYHSMVYPELAVFMQNEGLPDYIIEDHGFSSREVILFYLKTNQAYLFDIHARLSGLKEEIKGPEPIGKKTRALLDAICHLETVAASLADDGNRGKSAH